MKTNYKILNYLAGLVLVLPFGQAGAVLIDSYSGTDKGVDYTSGSFPGLVDLYDIWYTLDTTNFFSSWWWHQRKSLHAVSVKAFSSISDPRKLYWTPSGSWTAVEGQINANTTATNKHGKPRW